MVIQLVVLLVCIIAMYIVLMLDRIKKDKDISRLEKAVIELNKEITELKNKKSKKTK